MTYEPFGTLSKRKLTFRAIRGLARSGLPAVASSFRQRPGFARIAWLARHDALTGLPNRLMLTDALGAAMQQSAKGRPPCALLLVDLDRFKAINDAFGHPVGDRLLKLVAHRLASVVGQHDVCARLGGDEFGIVLRNAGDPAQVGRLARAIIARLGEPYTIDNQVLHIGASAGAAWGRRDGDTVELLLRSADLALYRAKDGGGGRFCVYEPVLLAQAQGRRQLEMALRQALDRDELRLEYRPVVDARDEHVVTFQALLRWHHAELGDVAPPLFMPLAEETRLIVPIGIWIIREACRQAGRWPAFIRVAVPVSGEQLADPGFHEAVVGALADAGLPAERLEIEVTERIFLRDAAAARIALERIMTLGCAVTLNDFGTGFSSLGHIHKLRFAAIKLDASFVQGAAAGNRESLAVIRAVVAMADGLGLAITAEGVETESERALVRGLGCHRIQGFCYGRPLDAEGTLARVMAEQSRAAVWTD